VSGVLDVVSQAGGGSEKEPPRLLRLEEDDLEQLGSLAEPSLGLKSFEDRARVDTMLDTALQKLGELDAEISTAEEIADQRKRDTLERIERWLAGETAPLRRQRDFLARQIEAIARQYDFGGKKSRSLPHGKFGRRRSGDKIEITDMPAALAFAERMGVEVKVVREVQRTPIKDFLSAHPGFKPNPEEHGFTVVPGTDNFYVEPAS
jgi:phage host-nuclease inhibitor protein Gam